VTLTSKSTINLGHGSYSTRFQCGGGECQHIHRHHGLLTHSGPSYVEVHLRDKFFQVERSALFGLIPHLGWFGYTFWNARTMQTRSPGPHRLSDNIPNVLQFRSWLVGCSQITTNNDWGHKRRGCASSSM
jgi:hypothetical protein